jgi:hypothetical protein
MRRLRNNEREVVSYIEVGEHEFELTAIVDMEFVPREPDVGIMQSSWNGAGIIKLSADEGAPFPLPEDEDRELEERILEKAAEDANNDEPDFPDEED